LKQKRGRNHESPRATSVEGSAFVRISNSKNGEIKVRGGKL